MFNLPAHLSTLNAIHQSPPSSALTQAEEEAFWGFMHTDELFSNFGVAPSELENKDNNNNKATDDQFLLPPAPAAAPAQLQIQAPLAETPLNLGSTSAPTPVAGTNNAGFGTPAAPLSATTLESFLAAFANDPSQLASGSTGINLANSNNAMANPNYFLNLSLPYSTAATPATGISTSDLLGSYQDSPLENSADEPLITGAKRLKQVGAGVAEIEEDKRRRNTEASARFRQKKKERELAVEKRAKDLEAQVAQLAADKASLENENRLLKAIVLNGSTDQAGALQNAFSSYGKRKREA